MDTPAPQKKLWKRIARALAFLVLVALLVALIDTVLSPKNEITEAFYAEPDNTIDVLFVGGSHASAAFDPTQLWQQHGFTSYTLYSWGQPAWTSYHYVKEALKSQRPKVVVVEGYGFMYGNSYLADADFDDVSDDFSLQIRPGLNRLQLAMAMSRQQTNGRPFYRYASLLRYHNRWQVLNAESFAWFFEDHSTTAKGFGPLFTTEAFPGQAPPQEVPAAQMHPGAREYLEKLVQLSKDEGFALVLAMAPYVVEADTEWAVYAEMEAYCRENGVSFINYNQPDAAGADFSFSSDMAEHAHVNLFGAEKITSHIGSFLAGNFPLPDRRGDDAYDGWNTAAQTENRDKVRMRLKISPNAGAWLPKLQNPDFAAFLVSRGDLAGPGNEPLLAGFAALGLSPDALAGAAPATLAVLDGGEVVLQQNGEELAATHELEGLSIQLKASSTASSILINGTEHALNHDGVAVVVIDKSAASPEEAVIQSVVFNPAEGSITRTD